MDSNPIDPTDTPAEPIARPATRAPVRPPAERTARPTLSGSDVPRRPVARPDPRPMRAILGLTGIAAAAAIATAIIRPPTADPGSTSVVIPQVADPTASVRHVTKYVQLKPGQTAPPNAAVKVVPKATPRVVIVTTHQSGKP